MTLAEARAVCDRCRRPASVCYCAHIPTLPTRTQVLLLQHPRERDNAIGTARMAHLALPGSVLRVGVTFDDDTIVRRALAERPAYLLFPGPGALAPSELPDEAITLVVVDGTWWQAKKLVRANPLLQALPRVGLSPSRPSEYQIRRQPAELCVSTIEALAETLTVLERAELDTLRVPFRAMVATQQRFQAEVQSRRHQKPRAPRPSRRERLRDKLAALWPRLVVIQGDANGWARTDRDRQPSEMIAWRAVRLADGTTFGCIVAPRRPLAPLTVQHTGLSEETMAAGIGAEEWRARWDAFTRPDDVVVHWGRYYVELAEQTIALPTERLDARVALTEMLRGRVTDAADAASKLGLDLVGHAERAQARLDALCAVLRAI